MTEGTGSMFDLNLTTIAGYVLALYGGIRLVNGLKTLPFEALSGILILVFGILISEQARSGDLKDSAEDEEYTYLHMSAGALFFLAVALPVLALLASLRRDISVVSYLTIAAFLAILGFGLFLIAEVRVRGEIPSPGEQVHSVPDDPMKKLEDENDD